MVGSSESSSHPEFSAEGHFGRGAGAQQQSYQSGGKGEEGSDKECDCAGQAQFGEKPNKKERDEDYNEAEQVFKFDKLEGSLPLVISTS